MNAANHIATQTALSTTADDFDSHRHANLAADLKRAVDGAFEGDSARELAFRSAAEVFADIDETILPSVLRVVYAGMVAVSQ